MNHRVSSSIAVGLLTLGVAGCGAGSASSAPAPGAEREPITHSVEVTDGRVYDCFRYTAANRGGIDCTDITSTDAQPNPSDVVHVTTESIGQRVYYCLVYTQVLRGGLDCIPVSQYGITVQNSQTRHNSEIIGQFETRGGRGYDCFVYTQIKRGGIACSPVVARQS